MTTKEEKKARKETNKAWRGVRKEMAKNIHISMADTWAGNKTTVIGGGVLGAAVAVAISEGIWHLAAPGSEHIGRIISDVGAGVAGGAGGVTGGLYLARSQERNRQALTYLLPMRAICDELGVEPGDVQKAIASKDDFVKLVKSGPSASIFQSFAKLQELDPEAFAGMLEELVSQAQEAEIVHGKPGRSNRSGGFVEGNA